MFNVPNVTFPSFGEVVPSLLNAAALPCSPAGSRISDLSNFKSTLSDVQEGLDEKYRVLEALEKSLETSRFTQVALMDGDLIYPSTYRPRYAYEPGSSLQAGFLEYSERYYRALERLVTLHGPARKSILITHLLSMMSMRKLHAFTLERFLSFNLKR